MSHIATSEVEESPWLSCGAWEAAGPHQCDAAMGGAMRIADFQRPSTGKREAGHRRQQRGRGKFLTNYAPHSHQPVSSVRDLEVFGIFDGQRKISVKD